MRLPTLLAQASLLSLISSVRTEMATEVASLAALLMLDQSFPRSSIALHMT